MSMKGLQLTKTIEIDQIINASYQNLLPGVTHKLAAHSSRGVIYVEQGEISAYAGRDRYILESGEMLFLAPMKEYCIESNKEKTNIITFSFAASGEFPAWDKKVFLLNYQQKHYLNEIIALNRKLQQMSDDLEEKTIDGQILKNTMELLVLSMITSRRAKEKEISETRHSFVERKNIANDIIQYLNSKVGEPVKLQDIAEQFSYSLSSIKRIFKKETGQSIIDYQNNIRIAEAKRLLKDSNASIQEISNSLGFVNAGYFARSFKKREGISPTAYRKAAKNQKGSKADDRE